MRNVRRVEVNVLGYRIQRIESPGHPEAEGAYEVLAPDSDELLSCFPNRLEAERYIVTRELSAARRVATRRQLPY